MTEEKKLSVPAVVLNVKSGGLLSSMPAPQRTRGGWRSKSAPPDGVPVPVLKGAHLFSGDGMIANQLVKLAAKQAVESLREKKGARLITPYMVMKEMMDTGSPFVEEETMIRLMKETSSELGLREVATVTEVDGRETMSLAHDGVSLEQALLATFGEDGLRLIDIQSENRIYVRSGKGKPEEVADGGKADDEEPVNEDDLSHFWEDVVRKTIEEMEDAGSDVSVVTTKQVLLASFKMKEGEESGDKDGSKRKRIATALKTIGYTPEVRSVSGKKVKVFVMGKEESILAGLGFPGTPSVVVEAEAEVDVFEEIREPYPAAAPEPPPAAVAADVDKRTELPSNWKEMLIDFLQASAGRTFVSLDEALNALGRIPNEMGARNRSIVSKFLLSLDMAQTSFGDRKSFHPPGNPPSMDELAEHFSWLDEMVATSLSITEPADAPDWMTKEQRVQLSFLEHAVLMLCDDSPHTRAALFPTNGDVAWQRGVLERLINDGLVEAHGTRFSAKYSGVPVSIEKTLNRDFLLWLFWPEEMEEVGSPFPKDDDPPASREDEGEDEDEDEDDEPEEESEPVEGEPDDDDRVRTLETRFTEMYEVMKNHAQEIGKLKARIKELEKRK